MHSQSYVIKFVLVMTVIVALVLALMSTGLKGIHSKNEAIYNKKAILGAIAPAAGIDVSSLSGDQIQQLFNDKIEQVVVDFQGNPIDESTVMSRGYTGGKAESVDMAQEIKRPVNERYFPVYKYKGDKEFYVFTVRGKGLWDEIWGNIALESDLNTIAGVAFDHKAETPGLGAEIKDNPAFPKQFIGKKLFDMSGNYKSVDVVKGGAKDPAHEVDGISGATITGDGVASMMYDGLELYQPYIKTVKK